VAYLVAGQRGREHARIPLSCNAWACNRCWICGCAPGKAWVPPWHPAAAYWSATTLRHRPPRTLTAHHPGVRPPRAESSAVTHQKRV